MHRARMRAAHREAEAIGPEDLLAGLVDEPESQAARLLRDHGVERDAIYELLGIEPQANSDDSDEEDPDWLAFSTSLIASFDLRSVVTEAGIRARSLERGRGIGTEHLLQALLDVPCAVSDLLVRRFGHAIRSLTFQLDRARDAEAGPLAVPEDLAAPVLHDPTETIDVGRVLDASANRAREGLRVVEDYVRFAMDDPFLTKRLKLVRHRLSEAIGSLDRDLMLGARDTRGDVGTAIMTANEAARTNPEAVLTANYRRITEALRSLEEYTKLDNSWLAGRFEVLRYDVYTLEKLTANGLAAHRSLEPCRLYLIVGGLPTLGDLTWLVGEAIAGGVQVVQLREKGLADREILERARELRILTAEAGVRFVLNDRPDLARIAGADGVHVGQDDLRVRDVRRVAGPRIQVGVSTHDPGQFDQALLDGASYLGVGPVFASQTKSFADEDLAGLALVRHAAETTSRPWFALGGIGLENLEAVLSVGATRVAVSQAILRAERPREAASTFRERLEAVGT